MKFLLRRGHTSTVLPVLIALCAALMVAGCQEQIEFTRKPAERVQTETRPDAMSPVFIVSHTDAGPWQREIESQLPDRLIRLSVNLSRAACIESGGRKRCGTARVRGDVVRDGKAILKGTPEGFSIRIPARYAFDVRGRGAARSVKAKVEGRVVFSAPFNVLLDENWQPDVRFDGSVSVEGGEGIRILERSLDVGRPLTRKFRGRFRRMARLLAGTLDTSKAAEIVETTWRHMHYPIELRREPALWLRGDPKSIAFGGLDIAGDTVELRIAVLGKLATFTDDRPVPLIARAMPSLEASPTAEPASHLVMPVELPYEEITKRIKASLSKAGLLKSPHTDKAKGFKVTDVRLFPADGRLAMAVQMESEIEGSWQKLMGTAYVVATPEIKPGSGVLGLKLAGFTPPRSTPSLYDAGRFIVPDTPLIAAFREGMKIRLKDRFASVLGDINRVADVPFAKRHRILGRFDDLSVHSIETHENGLRINLDMIGAISVYPGAPSVAAELKESQPVSAAQ